MNVPEKKESVSQAVSESEYELKLSIKKSAVPEEQDDGKQAEAAVTAVPTADKDEDIHAVIKQVINDDEDEPEEADKMKRVIVSKKRQERNAPEAKKQTFPKASRFDSAFTILPNFDNFDGKSDETKYEK